MICKKPQLQGRGGRLGAEQYLDVTYILALNEEGCVVNAVEVATLSEGFSGSRCWG